MNIYVFNMCVLLGFCVCVQSEKLLLFDTVQSELEEKIRRLEEDRHSIDITSGITHTVITACLGLGAHAI